MDDVVLYKTINVAAKGVEKLTQGDQVSNGNKSPTPKTVEYHILLIGSHHKQPLFEKLCAASEKCEKHVSYNDTFYLTFTVDGIECIVELNDPGMEHTGAREMAIRKAEACILCYAAYNIASFHQLSGIANDFKMRKNGKYPPVTLICNEDEIIESDDDEGASTAGASSTSEGYESEEPQHPMRKRKSMENIRKAHEDAKINAEQGESLSKLFGPECKFISLSLLNFNDARTLIEDLIRTINKENPGKIKLLRKTMSKSSKIFSLGNSRRNSRANSEETGGQTPPAGTPVNEAIPEIVDSTDNIQNPNSRKLKKVVKASKVCTVM